ncbi:Glucose-1-phosphate thymidylyltransferase, partial [hydrothermal vent metagenome]
MKALIFAAGRGERLKPLTDHTPKPMVKVQGKPLIQYHIEALLKAGITDLVINVSWLKEPIITFVTELCTQSDFAAVNVQFSIEADYPLETGGGMLKALPLLSNEPFVVVNSDVFTDFDFSLLKNLTADQLLKL